MIKNIHNKKVTPKQAAQEAIMFAATNACYHIDTESMTDREIDLVREQLEKQKQRIEKMFGYEPGSWTFE